MDLTSRAHTASSHREASKSEAFHTSLVPAEVVGELVAQGPLDLSGEKLAIVAEVTFEGVAVDDDPVLVAFTGDPVAVIHPVGVVLRPEIGDDHRDALQHFLELLRQSVDRVDDEGLELIEVRSVGHSTNGRGCGRGAGLGPECLRKLVAGMEAYCLRICDHRDMGDLPRITLSGEMDGNYVVLLEHAGGGLRIAPEQRSELPKIVTLRQTSSVAPAQWEGELNDGRVLYAHYRRGQLNVGIGEDRDGAIANSFSGKTLLTKQLGCELEGAMDFEELRAQLYGLLEFPEGLTVESGGKREATTIDAEASGAKITAILDSIPGAWERTQEGLEQARRGEGVPLEEL